MNICIEDFDNKQNYKIIGKVVEGIDLINILAIE